MLHIDHSGFTTTKSFALTGGDYVNCGNVLDKTGSAAFSVEGYIKRNTSGVQMLVNKRDSSAGPGWQVYLDASDRAYFYIQDAGGGFIQVRTSALTIGTGTWRHIAFTYDGSKNASGVNIYLGAVLAPSPTVISNTFSGTATNSRPLWIGNRETSAFPFDGRLHRMSVWNKALLAAEVTEAMNLKNNAGLLAHSASGNLEAYWRMGNDPMDSAVSGTGVIKERVGGFDGTPQGTIAGDIVTDAP